MHTVYDEREKEREEGREGGRRGRRQRLGRTDSREGERAGIDGRHIDLRRAQHMCAAYTLEIRRHSRDE